MLLALDGTTVTAKVLDLSPSGVRVRLPCPVPRTDRVFVGRRLLETVEMWGPARLRRVNWDRREAVLVFSETPHPIDDLWRRLGDDLDPADGAPLGRVTGERALTGARDVVSLTAILARRAAALGERAQVYWANGAGWSPIVESDGIRLHWGRQIQRRINRRDALYVVPITDAPEPRLLLLIEGEPSIRARGELERLARMAARTWKKLGFSTGGRLFLAWCALRGEAQRRLLDGLEHPDLASRKASMEALVRHGVDVMSYVPDLPAPVRARLRCKIEEMANFREWWIENVDVQEEHPTAVGRKTARRRARPAVCRVCGATVRGHR